MCWVSVPLIQLGVRGKGMTFCASCISNCTVGGTESLTPFNSLPLSRHDRCGCCHQEPGTESFAVKEVVEARIAFDNIVCYDYS